MSAVNSKRKNCKDVFNAFLVKSAAYAGIFEFPIIQPTYYLPNKLIAFSKAISCTNYNQWIHFYEDDYLFERIWRNPDRYLNILRRFNGVILPDFSLYRDMPFVMQIWNIYRSRAIGFWLQSNGIRIIVNVRFADYRTYNCCCSGISKNCVIAIGTHGLIKNKIDHYYFCKGLDVVLKNLQPSTVIVYGKAPDSIFSKFDKAGIRVLQFDSEIASYYKEES